MLLACAHGLDSCGIEAWTFWHKTAAAFLTLPAEEMVFCGMALGHADPDAAINRWRSSHEAVDRFAVFAGFPDAVVPQC